MSPESLEGKYCLKSDIWSCGVLMYYLISGYHPFRVINYIIPNLGLKLKSA